MYLLFIGRPAAVAEWQTHKTQNLAGVTSCGFKSHQPHKSVKLNDTGFTLFCVLYYLYFLNVMGKIKDIKSQKGNQKS